MIIRTKNKLRISIFFLLWVSLSSLYAQTPSINLEALKQKYKGDDVVYLKYFESLTIEPKGEDLAITDRTENQMLFLTESSSYYAQQQISYVDHVSSIDEIEAYTFVPKEKGGYKKVKVNEFTKSANTSQDVFYDDVSTMAFVFPQPTTGAVTVLNYTETIKDPHFLGKFYFASGHAIEEAVYKIKVHQLVDLRFILKNPKGDIEFKEVKEGNYKVYTWTRRNIPKLKSEENAKSIAYETPHLIAYVASYKGKSQVHKVLEDTKGLYKFCYGLLDKGLEAPDAEIKRITDSIVKNVTSDIEKVKHVYDYIQENINYIAFEDGLGGFIPRKPSLVCSRKYGDCKDIANLIFTMLTYAGIPTYHTWVGTMSIPYKFSEEPIMGVANHMIASVRLNNQWYFLDGTSKFLSYRYPSGFIQGKQAMIGINPDSFLLVDIPIVDAGVNLTKHTIYAAISNDTLKGNGIKILDGLPRCNMASIAYSISEKKRDEYWKSYLELGQNNCTIDKIVISGLKGRDSLLTYSYDYLIPKYVTSFEKELYVNLNLLKIWNDGDIDIETRTREYMFDETNAHEMVTYFKIPDGYSLVKLPANYSIDKGKFGFNFTYEQKGNTIVYTQKYSFNTLELNRADYTTWNETLALVHKAYRQTIALKKSN